MIVLPTIQETEMVLFRNSDGAAEAQATVGAIQLTATNASSSTCSLMPTRSLAALGLQLSNRSYRLGATRIQARYLSFARSMWMEDPSLILPLSQRHFSTGDRTPDIFSSRSFDFRAVVLERRAAGLLTVDDRRGAPAE